jgi:hypothetical protein
VNRPDEKGAKSIENCGSVACLFAMNAARQQKLAALRQTWSKLGQRSPSRRVRESLRITNVETQGNLRGHLVHVLTACATGPSERQLDFRERNYDLIVDTKLGAAHVHNLGFPVRPA